MLKFCMTGIALALAVLPAQAQGSKPITLVVGFAPGGTSSIVAHYLAEGVQARLKTAVIVENKPGAGGLVAADFVKKQAPDGATVLVFSSTTLMKFPPTPELVPIGQVATFDYIFAAGAAARAETVGEYLEAARADPALRTYASPGPGTLPHLIVEALAQQANVPLVVVQFRGSAPAALNVLGGHVPAAMLPLPDYLPHRDKSPPDRRCSRQALATAAERSNDGGRQVRCANAWVDRFVRAAKHAGGDSPKAERSREGGSRRQSAIFCGEGIPPDWHHARRARQDPSAGFRAMAAGAAKAGHHPVVGGRIVARHQRLPNLPIHARGVRPA